ncbi:unnamed protein product [Adineta steineri]|uniref:ADP ribosyltransferase domain-containing protein n=1 Tax=Adineta steineri TaxID=433720 RepID=A0A815DFA1_9BILA|nr:unnamed protein product [Adineta steineri]CAF4005028.1 unnamed protein product [Adineta steineri]
MPFLKWRKSKRSDAQSKSKVMDHETANGKDHHLQQANRTDQQADIIPSTEVILIYLTKVCHLQQVVAILNTLTENEAQIFDVEQNCIDFITSISKQKIFLVVDHEPSATLIGALEFLTQVDSLFCYSSTFNATTSDNNQIADGRIINRCTDEEILAKIIRQSYDDLEKQTKAFSLYNSKEKATRDISKEAGAFLFFQMFKTVLMAMPKTTASKQMMLDKCRDFYRGNLKELANISEFELTYKSTEAIPWYTKESFVYKFINKALRTEDVEVLYHFRFYIIDLCKQLEEKFEHLKAKQKGVLKLYRGLKIALTEIKNFEENIGNLISTNGYLSTSNLHSVAYEFATKPSNREGVVCALFEYQVDLNLVKKIVIADIAEYSAFPEEAEMLVDIGASFRIESCTFDAGENLWHVIVQATDQGAALADEFIEYQKKKMADANIILMFGHLLVEMGEYEKAKKYLNTVLDSNPNDEEVACIYYNFGRAYRLKGDFKRAEDYFTQSFQLHEGAKPKRLASAAKSLNGMGITCVEQNKYDEAIEHFETALKFLDKTVSRKHVDVGGILINLASIYNERGQYELAAKYVQKAIKIYEASLPIAHPNNALALVGLANIHSKQGKYEMAHEEFDHALKLQETSLPNDHADIIRTLQNKGSTYGQQGNFDKAREYLDRAAKIAERTLIVDHPLRCLIVSNQVNLSNSTNQIVIIRL